MTETVNKTMKTVTEVKYYSQGDIEAEYGRLTKDEREKILWSALDYMQQYNGRTKIKCVAMALGYDNSEVAKDLYYKK